MHLLHVQAVKQDSFLAANLAQAAAVLWRQSVQAQPVLANLGSVPACARKSYCKTEFLLRLGLSVHCMLAGRASRL